LSETQKSKIERPEEKIKSDTTVPFLSLYAPVTPNFNNIKVTPMNDGYTDNDYEHLLRITVMTSSTLVWIWQLRPKLLRVQLFSSTAK